MAQAAMPIPTAQSDFAVWVKGRSARNSPQFSRIVLFVFRRRGQKIVSSTMLSGLPCANRSSSGQQPRRRKTKRRERGWHAVLQIFHPYGDLCKSVAADVSPLRFHFGIEEIMEPTHIGCYDNSSFAEIFNGVPSFSPCGRMRGATLGTHP